jgi:Zn-dependent protease with chaperone function
MPLLLLLLLYLACLGEKWPRPDWIENSFDGVIAASLQSCAALLFVIALAAIVALRVRRRLRQCPQDRENVLRRYGAFRFYNTMMLFAVYGTALYALGWGWAAQYMCSIGDGENAWLIPGAELVILAPLLIAMALSWTVYYTAERALYDCAHPLTGQRPFWTRAAYVSFHARQNLAMVLVPVVMLVGLKSLQRIYPALFSTPWFPVVAVGMVLLLITCLPWILRFVLGLRSMPQGELRDRLNAAARRLNFRCSDIMLWNTRNGVANALVVGIMPYLRYVVFSDRLLSDLTPDEVEAVFGHEAGHVKHHHMLYYMGFMVISLTVLASLWMRFVPRHDDRYALIVQPTAGASEETSSDRGERDVLPISDANQAADWDTPIVVGSLGAYIFLVFGFLSRRCERQADIYGCRAVSCGRPDCTGHDDTSLSGAGRGLCPTGIRTFIHALEKVASLNGISRSKHGWLQSWLHSTIDSRVQFLQGMLADPTIEPRFQRRVGLVKWTLILILIAALGLIRAFPISTASEPPSGTQVPSEKYEQLLIGPHVDE